MPGVGRRQFYFGGKEYAASVASGLVGRTSHRDRCVEINCHHDFVLFRPVGSAAWIDFVNSLCLAECDFFSGDPGFVEGSELFPREKIADRALPDFLLLFLREKEDGATWDESPVRAVG